MGHKITKEKLDVLYQSHADDIYKVCLYITKDERKAQKIACQTFVIFYDQFQNINERCIFSYMVKTAKELANNYQREVKHQEQRRMYERQIKITYRTRAEVN